MNDTINRLLNNLGDEDYRYAYDEEFANSRMAMQIQVIREDQGLTQKELAELAEMRQSRISELENVNYSMWTVSTLRRIAQALGVRFFFGFESWSELLTEVRESDRKHLVRPKFERDPALKRKRRAVSEVATPIYQQQMLFVDSRSLLPGGALARTVQQDIKPEGLNGLSLVNQQRQEQVSTVLSLVRPNSEMEVQKAAA